jgi:hypothetical protein
VGLLGERRVLLADLTLDSSSIQFRLDVYICILLLYKCLDGVAHGNQLAVPKKRGKLMRTSYLCHLTLLPGLAVFSYGPVRRASGWTLCV